LFLFSLFVLLRLSLCFSSCFSCCFACRFVSLLAFRVASLVALFLFSLSVLLRLSLCLVFASRTYSASTDAGEMSSLRGALSIVVEVAVPPAFIFSSRRVARASSVRDRFQIQCNKGIERASTHAAYLAVSQPSWLLLRSIYSAYLKYSCA